MDILLAKVLFELGLVGERTVVDAAVDALEGGRDSPSLRLLAGLGPSELAQTRDLLGKTAADLQLPVQGELPAILTAGKWVAQQGLTGKWTIPEALAWIAHHTWFAYQRSAEFEADPADRPPEIQRLVAQMELVDVLQEGEHVPRVFPDWLRARFLVDAEAVLRAVAENSDWPVLQAWQDVEWTGSEYKLRS
jgi:hypothetical protein